VRRVVSVTGLQGRALDAQGPPTASSQVDPFFHPEDPYETTAGPTGRFPPYVPRWSPGCNPNRLPQCFRRTGPRTCSIFRYWTPMLLEKVVVLALDPAGVRRTWARTDLFRSIDLGDEIRDSRCRSADGLQHPLQTGPLDSPVPTDCCGRYPSVGTESRVMAIDPGVRRFATTYYPEGTAAIDGNNSLDRLSRRLDRTKTTWARSIPKHPESRSKGQSRKQQRSHRTRLRQSKRR